MNEVKWIVVDGIEGVGKTTIGKYIASLTDGVYVATNTEGPIATAVRTRFKDKEAPITTKTTYGLWMFSSIVEAYQDRIRHLLTKGTTVVSDRWLSSLYAYQIHKSDVGIVKEMFLKAHDPVTCHQVAISRLPDLYVYCSAPVEVTINRAMNRGRNDRLDTLNRTAKLEILNGFDTYYDNYKGLKYKLDCSGTMEEVEENISILIKWLFQIQQRINNI